MEGPWTSAGCPDALTAQAALYHVTADVMRPQSQWGLGGRAHRAQARIPGGCRGRSVVLRVSWTVWGQNVPAGLLFKVRAKCRQH
ncbi:hypothetical protein M0657_004552 [Pyricularia oryzae]|nr:hypothetical protein M9X92_006360 [Pyricularia oryzae]KAI7924508.1 hypothetical protein M0657_004552 [Pyricularia oryzae]